jgi:alpha-ribazole phosphatase
MCLGTCPGGESRASFSERVCNAFLTILDMEKEQIKKDDRSVRTAEDGLFIVSHGGTQMAILERWGNPARDYYSWQRPCGCGWRLALSDTKLSDTKDKDSDSETSIVLDRPEEICFVRTGE